MFALLAERISRQYRNYGLKGAMLNAITSLQRRLLHKATFLYIADSLSLKNAVFILPDKCSISDYHSRSDIPANVMDRYFQYVGKESTEFQIEERFKKRAILWIFSVDNNPAGFVWSITGTMMEPYFVPLAPHDSVLFDAVTFPEYRGKSVYPLLLCSVASRLLNGGSARVFGHAEEWNLPSIRGLQKANFISIGKARKLCIFGTTILIWSKI